MKDNSKFGSSDSLIAAVRSIMEKEHTVPKGAKEKKLAALAHPKDKITHKDVLVGRGVLKKENSGERMGTIVATRKEKVEVDPKLKEEEQVDERKLTGAETDKKEKYVMSLKKKMGGFKKRYGERAKEVMYATATKMAKEEVAPVNELSKQTMGSYIKKASHDVATKSAATGRYADRANAVKDQMKKGDYSNYQQGKKDDATADKMFKKSWKRRAGIAKATDKLTKD